MMLNTFVFHSTKKVCQLFYHMSLTIFSRNIHIDFAWARAPYNDKLGRECILSDTYFDT